MDFYDSVVERKIREAQEHGEFDNLAGTGKPLPGVGEPYDEQWWLKQWIQREEIGGFLPATLTLRKDAEELMESLSSKGSEAEVRRIIADLNVRIVKANRGLLDGPPVVMQLLDMEEVVAKWRRSRSGG
jgi:DnaJ homologue, subfamily C, member 28, conserved domain